MIAFVQYCIEGVNGKGGGVAISVMVKNFCFPRLKVSLILLDISWL